MSGTRSQATLPHSPPIVGGSQVQPRHRRRFLFVHTNRHQSPISSCPCRNVRRRQLPKVEVHRKAEFRPELCLDDFCPRLQRCPDRQMARNRSDGNVYVVGPAIVRRQSDDPGYGVAAVEDSRNSGYDEGTDSREYEAGANHDRVHAVNHRLGA